MSDATDIDPTSDLPEPLDPAAVAAATALLESLVDDRARLASLPEAARRRLLQAAGSVSRPDAIDRRRLLKETKRRRRQERRERAEAVLQDTGIRALRDKPVFTTPNYYPSRGDDAGLVDDPDFREVVEDQNCYVCKQDYNEVHAFYDQLCPTCAAFNFAKRGELADLSGCVALVTGGRVKIGYQAVIKLLRSGCRVLVTTRFPRDGAERFTREADFDVWKDRLEVHGLDLRHTPSVEAFAAHLLAREERLDFIVNNACQTVRRPPAFYAHMMEAERASAGALPKAAQALLGAYEGLRGFAEAAPTDPAALALAGAAALVDAGPLGGITHAADLSQVALTEDDLAVGAHLFPEGRLDQDLQQVDLRDRNSWRLLLHEVSTVELLEVHLVNAVAPFVLNARLRPLMARTPGRAKHIVNVSAVEGQFYRPFKTTRHPHTNMAKAALNMMTRTAAADYLSDGIHMNAVDTGWVTDEDPAAIADRKREAHRFHPPLDIVDGAARIVDPIIAGVNTGEHVWGKFLKDYKPTDW